VINYTYSVVGDVNVDGFMNFILWNVLLWLSNRSPQNCVMKQIIATASD